MSPSTVNVLGGTVEALVPILILSAPPSINNIDDLFAVSILVFTSTPPSLIVTASPTAVSTSFNISTPPAVIVIASAVKAINVLVSPS